MDFRRLLILIEFLDQQGINLGPSHKIAIYKRFGEDHIVEPVTPRFTLPEIMIDRPTFLKALEDLTNWMNDDVKRAARHYEDTLELDGESSNLFDKITDWLEIHLQDTVPRRYAFLKSLGLITPRLPDINMDATPHSCAVKYCE